ncbi:MAG: mce related protein [Candidatus Omnitrophica bacterium ADurb.Bin314]|jgi:phospholipid/cholesterol/gamma-HCH transport system substrate-binding protein|nr:MAG: mce related protein [Candidatus Omnitrophica bacterium ADurb.Bin314]HOE68073.1 MlaD family protein [Candidatus Omnitrophota bacterium]
MKKNTNEMAVGVFVIVGFIFLTMVLFFVSGVYLFRSGYGLRIMYEYVSILDRGAPVRMAGVRVGEVSKVRLFFDEMKKKNRVEVKLFIEKGVEIGENYQFKIQGTHILSEPHIEITPVVGATRLLKDGDSVEGVSPVAVEELVERAHEISNQISEIMAKFRAGVESDGTIEDLKTMVKNFSDISTALNTTVGGSEGRLKQSVQNIESSTDSLSKILDGVERGEGTLGKLLREDELYEEMCAFVKDIRAHPWKLLKKDSKDGKKKKWYYLFLK